jgi:phosphatidylinositol glycan class N
VFGKVKDFFKSAATNATLDALLREDKLVFFLHLLGLDTAGHAYRPYSKEYLHNIKIVDKGVQEISQLIDDFYDDQRTAYVFTADHGMSDWGSHGDGHPDNTRTPLIVWGAGVAQPLVSKTAGGHEDGFSADWGLDHISRHDVAQADIATLMAYLVGLEFPVNSVGVLPLDYLDAGPERKAEAVLVNAREILEMYRVKEERKKATQLKFRPYPPLSHDASSVDERLNAIRGLIDSGRPQEAIDQGLELISLGLAGLHYLQRYDWFFLRSLATFGYLGWIAFALTTVIDLHVLGGTTQTARTTPVVVFFSSVLVALYTLLWVQRSPWTYYAYAFFPVLFWEEVVAQRAALAASKSAIFGHINSTAGYIALGVKALVFVALIQTFVSLGKSREGLESLCRTWLGVTASGMRTDIQRRQGIRIFSSRGVFRLLRTGCPVAAPVRRGLHPTECGAASDVGLGLHCDERVYAASGREG